MNSGGAPLNSDAFSRTLESRPRHKRTTSHSSSQHHHQKDGSVNRISRAFEHDSPQPHQASDSSPALTAGHAQPARPALPRKPPSLRMSSNLSFKTDALISPSTESLPSSPSTVATSVTSYTSDAQFHHRRSWTKEEELQERPKRQDQHYQQQQDPQVQRQQLSSTDIDQTSLAFSDIRARFQQGATQKDPPAPAHRLRPLPSEGKPLNNLPSRRVSQMRSKPSQIDHHPSSHVKPQPPSIPAKSWMPRPPPQNNNGAHTTTTKATGDKITTHLSSSPSSTPKTGSFVAELSKRLEEQADAPPSPRRPLSSTGSPRTSVLRKTSNISHTTLPKRPSVTNFASHTSQSPHQHLATHITTAANAAATTASVPSSISAPPPPAAITQRSSSSSSTVSSTLHLPVIARTGTGNSTASTSSLSTTDSPSRRAWQYGAAITSWFTGSSADDHHSQQSLKDSITIVSKDPLPAEDRSPSGSDTATSFPASLPVSPQLSGKQELKRSKVVRELVETECAYQSDMIVIKEIYYDQAHSVLAPADIKILFSNLTTILEFERPFVNELKEAEVGLQDEMDQDTTTVGKVFRQNMRRLDTIYCDYCKRHEDAVVRLQELEAKPNVQQFLSECRTQMQGRTTSWDLGSLLIKPVQRVLKYPLLLREIFLLTPASHPDHDDLAAAMQEIQEVADHINEIKRRKDIVEKIVGDKKKSEINVVHGINKKITRRAQRFKQATGFAAEATQDALFDTLHLRFEEQREVAQQLARDVQGWVRQIRHQFEMMCAFAESFEATYSAFGGVRVRSMESIKDFGQSAKTFASVMSRELDSMVQGYVYSRIDDFLRVYENPSQVINKRAQKLLDYDRVRGIRAKGDTPDKASQESADAYVSINAQLVDELPKLFRLTGRYFDILIGDLAQVQANYYKQMEREWQKILQRHFPGQSADGLIEHYQAQMAQVVEPLLADIAPLNAAVWDAVPGAMATPEDENSARRSDGSSNYFGDDTW